MQIAMETDRHRRSENQAIQTQVQIDLSSSRATIARVELNQILSLPFLSQLPTSGDTMRYCRTMRERRRKRLTLPPLTVQQLEKWSKDRRCSFLFTESRSTKHAKDFLVDFVDVVLAAGFPSIWALRFEDYWKRSLDVLDLVKMSLLHSLQANPGALQASPSQ